MMNKADDVVDQFTYFVIPDVSGFVAQVVAAKVGSHDGVVVAECGQLMPPRIPAFRETVQQEYQPLPIAGFCIMQIYAADLGVVEGYSWIDRHYNSNAFA